jgi:hypothetical protein
MNKRLIIVIAIITPFVFSGIKKIMVNTNLMTNFSDNGLNAAIVQLVSMLVTVIVEYLLLFRLMKHFTFREKD